MEGPGTPLQKRPAQAAAAYPPPERGMRPALGGSTIMALVVTSSSPDDKVWGRPLGVAVAHHGSLLKTETAPCGEFHIAGIEGWRQAHG